MYVCVNPHVLVSKHKILHYLLLGQTTSSLPLVNDFGKPKPTSFIPPYLLALEDGGILIQSLKHGISIICFGHGHFKMF